MKTRKTLVCCILAVILTLAFSACDRSFELSNNKTVLVYYRGEEADVVIPKGVKVIGEGAFNSNTNLVSVTIPASVTSISRGAFISCERLTTVTFASKSRLASIGESAFAGCGNLTAITIPASVMSIGEMAFWNCGNLTAVTFAPKSRLASIGETAFSLCGSLAAITIPASVTSIGEKAFFFCTNLTTVTFAPKSQLASIGESAFSFCTSLASITIPKSVTSIGEDAFSFCFSLTSFTVDADNPNYSSENGILYNKAKTTLIMAPPKGISGSVTIPTSVTSIANYAFQNCDKITSITIPKSVTSIGEDAFWNCEKLAAITIPANVASIGREAFGNCTSLTGFTVDADNSNYLSENGILYNKAKTALIKAPPRGISGSVTIPTSVTSIVDSAFDRCNNLTAIIIPEGVVSIGIGAFGGCTSLVSITVDINNPNYSSHDSILYDKEKTTLIQAPQRLGGSVTISASVMIIQSGAFSDCTSINSLTIHKDVITVHEKAFENWDSGQTIIIQGKANQEAADEAWGESWREDCEARILYRGLP